MKRPIGTLFAAALLALGFSIPAQSQEQAPWYMPQAWVHPQPSGPSIRPLPGYYGHNLRYRSYGNFSTGCYGNCNIPRGTISTGYGVTLYSPAIVAYNPSAYQLVPNAQLSALQDYATGRASAQFQQANAGAPTRQVQPTRHKPQPNLQMQNGVRVIRPAPLPY